MSAKFYALKKWFKEGKRPPLRIIYSMNACCRVPVKHLSAVNYGTRLIHKAVALIRKMTDKGRPDIVSRAVCLPRVISKTSF